MNSYADKPLSEILDLTFEFEVTRNDLSIYDKKPLIENGILIEHFDNSFVYDLSQRKRLHVGDKEYDDIIRSKLKDSLVLYDLMNLVVVKDFYTGEILYKRGKQRGYQIQSKTPILLKSNTFLFKEKNNILNCVNILTKSIVWQRSFPEMIYAFIEGGDSIVNLTTKTTFYQIDKNTGEIIWNVALTTENEGSLNSEINISGDLLYLWAGKDGLIVIDLAKRTVKEKWLTNMKVSDFTMQIAFDGDTIFAKSPTNVYCLSASTGDQFWVSKDLPIRSDLIIHNEFIFFYQKGREGGVDALSALSRSSHEIEYATFTSEEFPSKDIAGGIYDSELDLTNINFVRRPYQGDLLIGSDGSKIYCFEIVK
tara:strand:- start:4682 stop:5779 length:1098 start_codon:yes stop_codon:yes gene_type:complete